jgi:AcrR family transcriptional regulator
VFAEQGLDVSVAQIACRASVGTATLFRNFPTKDDLVYAVIEARVTELLEIGRRALEVEDPTASFEQFLSDVADIQVRDHGFFEAIQTRLIDEPELLQCKLGMTAIAETILKRAQQAGAVRKDVVADDLPFILSASSPAGPHGRRCSTPATGPVGSRTGAGCWSPVDDVVQDVNRFLRGWAGYFRYGNSARQFNDINLYALNRLSRFVAKRHKRSWRYGWKAVAYQSPDRLGLINLNGTIVAPRPNRPWRPGR